MREFIETHPALSALAEQLVPQGVPVASHVCRFGKRETEDRAELLIQFLQRRRSWRPFHIKELQEFSCGRCMPHILLGLAGQWVDAQLGVVHDANYVQLMSDARCGVTDRFILRCAGYDRDRIDALIKEHVT